MCAVALTVGVLTAGCAADRVDPVDAAPVVTSVVEEASSTGIRTDAGSGQAVDGSAKPNASGTEPVEGEPGPEVLTEFVADAHLLDGWSRAGTTATAGETRLSVAVYGAVADDDTSDSAAFAAAVREAAGIDGAVTISVGEGTYLLTRTLELTDGITIKGQGPDTRIVLDLGGRDAPGIRAEGRIGGSWIALADAPRRGDTTITVDAGLRVTPGDVVELEQQNDESFYLREDWRVDWGQAATGEMNRVVSVDGRTVTLEAPILADYNEALTPRVRIIDPVREVGLED
ncbi:MAG: glycosyl hydrolase family 28-related protein, partial [Actinomycetota bacterium]